MLLRLGRMAKRQHKAKRPVLPGWLSGFSDEEGTEGELDHALLHCRCKKVTENESVLAPQRVRRLCNALHRLDKGCEH